jgi:hypothetical protein
MNSKQLKEKLDLENKDVVRLFTRDMRAQEGLSEEYKAAYKLAKTTWREWCDALDRGE